MDNIVKLTYYKSEKESGSVSKNQKKIKKNEKISRRFKRYC